MIGLLIDLIILLIVAGIVYYILTLIPLPEPFKRIVMILAMLILLLVVVSWLLPMSGIYAGHPLLR